MERLWNASSRTPPNMLVWEYLKKQEIFRKIKVHWLVDAYVVILLCRESEHAADHPAVHGTPLLVADLFPFATVFDLYMALGYRDSLPVGGQNRFDPHILHLDGQMLKREKCFPLNTTAGQLEIHVTTSLLQNLMINYVETSLCLLHSSSEITPTMWAII